MRYRWQRTGEELDKYLLTRLHRKHRRGEALVESFLGVIVAAITAMAQGVTQIFKWVAKNKRNEANLKRSKDGTALLSRYLTIFETKEIPRTLISRVLGLEKVLSVQQTCSDKLLTEQLNDHLIKHTAEFFALSSEWLYGATSMPYRVRSNYKHPGAALDTLVTLLQSNKQAHFSSAFLLATTTADVEGPRGDQAILSVFLEVPVSEIEGLEITRVYVLENHLPWTHPAARIHFKQLVLIARLLNLFVVGYQVPQKKHDEFEEGKLLPHQLLRERIGSWYPEDYVDSAKSSHLAKQQEESHWIREDALTSGLRDKAMQARRQLEYESVQASPASLSG